MIHGTNEHMTLDNLRRCVEFYARLVATTAVARRDGPRSTRRTFAH